jgi:hypothetical protein
MVDPNIITPQVSTIVDTGAHVPPQPPTTGLNLTWYTLIAADFANGISFPNTGREALLVRSTSSSVVTVTAQCGTACSQGYKSPQHDVIGSLAAGNVTPTFKSLGPFQKSRYNQTVGSISPAANSVLVNFAGDTANVQIAVLSTPLIGD